MVHAATTSGAATVHTSKSERRAPAREGLATVEAGSAPPRHEADALDREPTSGRQPSRPTRAEPPMPAVTTFRHEAAGRTRAAPVDPRRAAERALSETRPPASTDPMRQHIEQVRRDLSAAGLPASAPDVRVVINDGDLEHGGAVTRAAVGDVGPGRGAQARLLTIEQTDPATRAAALGLDAATEQRLRSVGPDIEQAQRGRATIDQLARTGTNILEDTVQSHRRELQRVRELAREDPSKPTVANMSWGGTVQQTAFALASDALRAPRDSALHRELTRELGRAPDARRDVAVVGRILAERMQRNMDDPVGGRGLRDAKAAFGLELAAASERDRVTVTTSMANQQQDADTTLGNPVWGASIIHDVPGHISVGATNVANPRRIGDETMAPFSSDGQVEVAAPGVQSPVGPPDRRGRAQRWDGTSFSAPYVAGTAALMLQANPRLTTPQIQQLLQATARDLPGTRDGAGIVDPVAAVQRARELAAP